MAFHRGQSVSAGFSINGFWIMSLELILTNQVLLETLLADPAATLRGLCDNGDEIESDMRSPRRRLRSTNAWAARCHGSETLRETAGVSSARAPLRARRLMAPWRSHTIRFRRTSAGAMRPRWRRGSWRLHTLTRILRASLRILCPRRTRRRESFAGMGSGATELLWTPMPAKSGGGGEA